MGPGCDIDCYLTALDEGLVFLQDTDVVLVAVGFDTFVKDKTSVVRSGEIIYSSKEKCQWYHAGQLGEINVGGPFFLEQSKVIVAFSFDTIFVLPFPVCEHIFLLLMTFLTLRTKLGSRIGYPIFAGAYTGF